MEKCLHSPKSTRDRWFGLVAFLCMGVLLQILAVLGFIEDADAIVMCALLFTTGLVLCFFGVFAYIIQSREYAVDAIGITVCYCKFYKVKYLWANIQNISICDVNHAAKNWDVFDVVIRIALVEEKHGPFSKKQPLTLSGHERWRSFGYSLLHFEQIIILDYSEERYNNIQMLSGKTIYDFRGKRAMGQG